MGNVAFSMYFEILQILTYHLWLLSLVSKFSFQLSKLIQWAAFGIEPFILTRMVDSWSERVIHMIPDFCQQEQDSPLEAYIEWTKTN